MVLGSTGMLWLALTKELKKQGKCVIGIARKYADLCLDITDEKLLLEHIATINPRVMINTVVIVDLLYCDKNPNQSYLTYARPSLLLARYSRKSEIKYVYISTDHYYSDDAAQKHCENCAVNLCNEYAATKYGGEIFALTDLNALIVRTNIVGFCHKKIARHLRSGHYKRFRILRN